MRPPESFTEQPVRSLQTMLRVIAEDDPTFPTVVPDGIYGHTTMAAVTEFQRRQGLPLTGITDQATWDSIVPEYQKALIRVNRAEPIEIIMDPSQVFVLGDEGPYIYLMQSLLIWLSKDYDTIQPPEHTGIFDRQSSQALSAFQALAGLEQTGTLDKITWKYLSRHFTLNAHHNSNRNIINANSGNNNEFFENNEKFA